MVAVGKLHWLLGEEPIAPDYGLHQSQSPVVSACVPCEIHHHISGLGLIPAYRPIWHSLTPAWTIAGNGCVSFNAAADVMAPVLSTGMLVGLSPLAIKPFGD